MEPFDEYISLGNRCETAFQILRVLGKDSLHPSFFNWNVTYVESLIKLLATRFDGILQADNITPTEWLAHDSVGNYLFHLVGEGKNSKDHPDFTSDLESHRSKVTHILDRYYTLAASGRRVCYFHRTEDTRDMLPYALQIREILRDIQGNDNFALVFIQLDEHRGQPWQEELVFNRYAKRLAPNEDQGDAHILSWDRVFREFPRHGQMNFSYWM